MKSKTFKIGEYAIGGIIKVSITATAVQVQALEWDSKRVIRDTSFSNIEDNYWLIKEELEEITSSYYAEEVMKFILENSNVNYQMFREF